jgi:hypothetical protein
LDTEDTAVLEDPAADDIPDNELPDDDEEFSSPPPALAASPTEAP